MRKPVSFEESETGLASQPARKILRGCGTATACMFCSLQQVQLKRVETSGEQNWT